MSRPRYSGGCLCGAVRIEVSAAPDRVGICHCLDCRKRQGAIFHKLELHAGCLDAPDQLTPTYESWVVRREAWLPAFEGTTLYERNRDA